MPLQKRQKMERLPREVQNTMLRLKGKIAVITGSTSGMGEAAAKLFASQGAKIVVVGRNEERGAKVVNHIKKKKGKARNT